MAVTTERLSLLVAAATVLLSARGKKDCYWCIAYTIRNITS